MTLRRAKTADEYVEWVRQALFEVGDLRDCLEFELEDLRRFPAFLDPLQEGIQGLYDRMRAGTYFFAGQPLRRPDPLPPLAQADQRDPSPWSGR